MDIKKICDIKSCNDGDRPGWAMADGSFPKLVDFVYFIVFLTKNLKALF